MLKLQLCSILMETLPIKTSTGCINFWCCSLRNKHLSHYLKLAEKIRRNKVSLSEYTIMGQFWTAQQGLARPKGLFRFCFWANIPTSTRIPHRWLKVLLLVNSFSGIYGKAVIVLSIFLDTTQEAANAVSESFFSWGETVLKWVRRGLWEIRIVL